MEDVRRSPVLLLVGLGGLLGALVIRLPSVVAVVVPTMAAGLVLTELVHILGRADEPEERERLLRWTLVAFAAHLAFGLIVTNSGGLSAYFGGDASTYHDLAVRLLQHWTQGTAMPTIPPGKEGFYYLLAGIYWIFGAYSSAGLVVNAAMASALVPIVADTTRRAFGRSAAWYVAPLVVLLPGLFLWTSQLLKEAGVLLFIAVAANCAGRILERVSPGRLVALAAAICLLFTFRGWVALMVLTGLMLGVTLGRQEFSAGLGSGLAIAALVALSVLGFGVGSKGYQTAVNSNLAQANVVRQDLASSASSGYAVDSDISSPTRALSFLPIGLVALLLGPAPWQVGGLRQLSGLADVAVWWLLLPSLWRGVRAAKQLMGRGRLVFLLPAASTSLLLALAIGNFGTVVRERMQIVVLVVPLIALGLAGRAEQRATRGADEAADSGVGAT